MSFKSNVVLIWPECRPWDRPVGVSGDITDIVLGLLALLAETYGVSYLKMEQYYEALTLFWQAASEVGCRNRHERVARIRI
jgi:hypothetical protein